MELAANAALRPLGRECEYFSINFSATFSAQLRHNVREGETFANLLAKL